MTLLKELVGVRQEAEHPDFPRGGTIVEIAVKPDDRAGIVLRRGRGGVGGFLGVSREGEDRVLKQPDLAEIDRPDGIEHGLPASVGLAEVEDLSVVALGHQLDQHLVRLLAHQRNRGEAIGETEHLAGGPRIRGRHEPEVETR